MSYKTRAEAQKKEDAQLRNEAKQCRKVLEDFLETSNEVIICSRNVTSYLDGDIARYLQRKEHESWLEKDVTAGYQVGGISEKVLCDFVKERKEFKGVEGKFKIGIEYGPMSVRNFKAVPPKSI